MPIKSYIAHPQDGKFKELLSALAVIENCEIIPSENKEIVVVITDTKNDIEDNSIQIKINAIKSLKMLSLVSGFEADQ